VTTIAAEPARTLDRKLGSILSGTYTPDDFVIADAKDGDMAFGVTPAGPVGAGGVGDPSGVAGPGQYGTREDYLDAMRALVRADRVDIMLTSASNGERLALEGSIGAGSAAGGSMGGATLAVRGNDTTDIWNQRFADYPKHRSRPFRTVNLPAIRPFCDLVLYSVTFNADLDHDLATLQAYAEFRRDAAAIGMRHFLEVFNPNAAPQLGSDQVGAYVNDSILRMLAGVTSAERPLFLKAAYNGTAALSELSEHDPSLVVGILGGSSGTTRDTFELLSRAEAAGARIALFGRKIQRAESQLDLVGLMRPVIRGDLTPADGVRAYHDALQAAGKTPKRSLTDDLQVTEPVLLAE
jgi:hypothetical protein